jgi:ABC-type dipeptide/oligopeptide/nickel transport system permease subunit
MWISTFSGIAIAIVDISINFFGDVTRDALDSFLRER